MTLDKAICVAVEALHEEFAATLAFRLQPQARLALWALLHHAGECEVQFGHHAGA